MLRYMEEARAARDRAHDEYLTEATRYLLLPIEAYEGLDVLSAERRAGRKALQDWQRCCAVMLRELELQRKMTLSADQMRLLYHMRNTMLRRMYGGDIETLLAERPWLASEMQIDECYDTLCVTYPRRSGKTLTETLAAAITLASHPEGPPAAGSCLMSHVAQET